MIFVQLRLVSIKYQLEQHLGLKQEQIEVKCILEPSEGQMQCFLFLSPFGLESK